MNQALTRIVDNEDKDVQQQTSETNLWTVRQVAEKFNVSEQTIRRDIKAEVLPHLRIRGCIRLPKQVVLDWVEAQTRYNWGCAGLAVRHPKGERKCLNSAKRRKVSTGAMEVGTGGHLTQRQAVGEFNALLGQPPRGKR